MNSKIAPACAPATKVRVPATTVRVPATKVRVPATTVRVLAAAAAVVVLLSACGSATPAEKTDAATPSGAITTTTGNVAGAGTSVPSGPQAYADCMRAHGIANFPSPVDGHITLTPASGINPNSPAFIEASSACAALGPSGSGSSSSGGGSPSASAGEGSKAPLSAWTWPSFAAWLGRLTREGRFSGSVLVADRGRMPIDAGYGEADRTTGVANTAQTRFCIASIGKLFTAVSIAQLAQRHELSFAATVGRYVPGLPSAIARHVTLAELLDMTSGLGNVALGQANPPQTLAGQVALIAREHLQFTPGKMFSYSNDGYILLGDVVQRVSRESYAGYIREHIFGPAVMTDTGYSVYTPAHVADMAHGYAQVGPSLRDISGTPQIANPSGGAYSTTGDLLKFARAVLDGRLIDRAMVKTILIPRINSPQPGGPPVDKYSYGFAWQAINGITFVGHNGGTPGYAGQIDMYPKSGYVVVVLTNQDSTMVPVIRRSEALITGS